MSQSAVWPLNKMLFQLLTGDATLAAKLAGGKVYSGRAPTNAPLDYIILGQSIETPDDLFGTGGHRGIERLHVWTDDPSKYRASMIANDLHRLLHHTAVTIDGHTLCTGSFSTLGILPDPTGSYTTAMCQYEVLSYEQ